MGQAESQLNPSRNSKYQRNQSHVPSKSSINPQYGEQYTHPMPMPTPQQQSSSSIPMQYSYMHPITQSFGTMGTLDGPQMSSYPHQQGQLVHHPMSNPNQQTNQVPWGVESHDNMAPVSFTNHTSYVPQQIGSDQHQNYLTNDDALPSGGEQLPHGQTIHQQTQTEIPDMDADASMLNESPQTPGGNQSSSPLSPRSTVATPLPLQTPQSTTTSAQIDQQLLDSSQQHGNTSHGTPSDPPAGQTATHASSPSRGGTGQDRSDHTGGDQSNQSPTPRDDQMTTNDGNGSDGNGSNGHGPNGQEEQQSLQQPTVFVPVAFRWTVPTDDTWNSTSPTATTTTTQTQTVGGVPDYQNIRSVAITGNFTRWKQKINLEKVSPTEYLLLLDLEPGHYFYRYIVDGEWSLDRSSQIVEIDGQICHYLEVPDIAADALQGDGTQSNVQEGQQQQRQHGGQPLIDSNNINDSEMRNEHQMQHMGADGQQVVPSPSHGTIPLGPSPSSIRSPTQDGTQPSHGIHPSSDGTIVMDDRQLSASHTTLDSDGKPIFQHGGDQQHRDAGLYDIDDDMTTDKPTQQEAGGVSFSKDVENMHPLSTPHLPTSTGDGGDANSVDPWIELLEQYQRPNSAYTSTVPSIEDIRSKKLTPIAPFYTSRILLNSGGFMTAPTPSRSTNDYQMAKQTYNKGYPYHHQGQGLNQSSDPDWNRNRDKDGMSITSSSGLSSSTGEVSGAMSGSIQSGIAGKDIDSRMEQYSKPHQQPFRIPSLQLNDVVVTEQQQVPNNAILNHVFVYSVLPQQQRRQQQQQQQYQHQYGTSGGTTTNTTLLPVLEIDESTQISDINIDSQQQLINGPNPAIPSTLKQIPTQQQLPPQLLPYAYPLIASPFYHELTGLPTLSPILQQNHDDSSNEQQQHSSMGTGGGTPATSVPAGHPSDLFITTTVHKMKRNRYISHPSKYVSITHFTKKLNERKVTSYQHSRITEHLSQLRRIQEEKDAVERVAHSTQ